MSRKRPKRNDPCSCGSGKLYKHCCKPSRRERAKRIRKIALAPAPAQRAKRDAPSTLGDIRSLLEDVRQRAPRDQVQEIEGLLNLAEEIAAYEEMHDEIEAAAETLEAHRTGFEALDLKSAAELADRLFSEERFRPLHFSAEQVHLAFEEVGYPSRHRQATERDAEVLRDAVLHLTDSTLRQRLARKLLMWLPEYVSAGRYLEAWMLQFSAFQMLEAPNENNPFLAEMFRHGFVEWEQQIKAEQNTLLRELGVDRDEITGLAPHEMEAWLQEKMADPETRARFDAQLSPDTIFGAQAQAEYWEMQHAALYLLGRDDADRLLLSSEEIEPWLPTLFDRLEPLEEQARAAAEREDVDDAEIQEAFGNLLLEVGRKMASALFTPERIDQLVEELRAYRDDANEAGDREAALYAHTAVTTLEHAEEPAEERFVIGVCIASLRWMMMALEQATEPETSEGEVEA